MVVTMISEHLFLGDDLYPKIVRGLLPVKKSGIREVTSRCERHF